MGITFKFLLNRRRLNAKGVYPIILRLYNGGNYREYSIGVNISPKYWSQDLQLVLPAHEESTAINAKIVHLQTTIKKHLLLADLEGNRHLDISDILNVISPTPIKHSNEKQSLIAYGRLQAEILKKAGKIGNSMVYTTAINKLLQFVRTEHFSFELFDYKKLSDFNIYLLAEGITVNGVSVYLRTIRAIYNKAIREGVASSANYPFLNYRIKTERTVSRALTLSEIQSIVNEDIASNTPLWHWRNYFILSFSLIGINFTDLLKLKGSNIIDGRVIFRRSKTGKIYSIKLNQETEQILTYYAGKSKDGYLLPVLRDNMSPLQQKNTIKQVVKTCNEYLKRLAALCNIQKEISTYYARYTWANIAKQQGYSKDMIAEALGHEYGNRVTGIYLDAYDNETIDAMNNKVIAVVFNK